MLSLPSRAQVYVCASPVDFPKQHDGLVAIVRGELDSDPLDGSLFAFFNRRRDRIKLLLSPLTHRRTTIEPFVIPSATDTKPAAHFQNGILSG